MIFYFTGTGNSLFAAKRLLSDGEQLVNIADALNEKHFKYEVQSGERVGFVFPVYFYTVPSIIEDFISKLTLKGADYVYAIITCGGSISQAGVVLKKLLAKQGIKLNYVKPLLMPDNSMLFYQIPPASEAGDRLIAAENRLKEIKQDIEQGATSKIGNISFVSSMTGAGYKLCMKTAKYYACINRCPKNAIQYGKLTVGRNRYVNPEL